MKTKTVTTKVFDFSELSEISKQNAIDKHYQNENYYYLYDDLMYSTIIEDDKYFSNIKLCYSISYCQGDGLSFSADFDFKQFLSDKYNFQQFKKDAIYQQYLISIKSNSGNYAYSSKSDVSYDENTYSSYFCTDLSNLDSLFQSVFEDVQNYYLYICSKLEKYAYEIIEYRMNFEEFEEYCNDNNYQFTEDGTIY